MKKPSVHAEGFIIGFIRLRKLNHFFSSTGMTGISPMNANL